VFELPQERRDVARGSIRVLQLTPSEILKTEHSPTFYDT
jgi:hypothetical protein